jgi:hypothetical protein
MAADSKTISVVFKAISDISDVDYNIKNIQKALQSLKLPDSLGTQFTKVFSELEREVSKVSEVMESGFQKKSDVRALESGYKKINNLMSQLQVNVSKISEADLNKSFQVDTAKTAELAKQIENIKKSIADGINPETFQKIAVAVKSMTDAGKGGKSIGEFFKGIQTGEIEQSEAALKKLESTLAGLRTRYGDDAKSVQEYAAVIDVLRSSFEQITNVEASDLINRLQELQEELKNLESTERAEFLAGFKQTSETVKKTLEEVRAFGDATVRAKTEVKNLTQKQRG